MKKTTNEVNIEIKPIKISRSIITIVGDTPLIVHAWSEKAKKQMLEAQQKKAKTKVAKPPKDPFQDFVGALYWIAGKPEGEITEENFAEAVSSGKAKFGFPCTAVKMAAIDAAFRSGAIPNKAIMRGAFYLNSPDGTGELLEIEGSAPECREDPVHIGSALTATTDLRYRPMFREWKMKMCLTHNDNGVFTLGQIINAINLGGFTCGIGEWRPDRDGQFGRFHVEIGG